MSGDIKSNLIALLLLNRLPPYSKEEFYKLLEVFGSPEAIIKEENERHISKVSDFGIRWVKALKKLRRRFDAERELEECEKNNVQLIDILDERYPSNLKEIHDPPFVLYVKGSLDSFHKASFAIVGSRRPSLYGEEIAEQFAARLSAWGLTIVSGLARGIDAAAHRGALRVKARTVGVLGSGIDVVYPKDNKELFRAIGQRGAIVSEFGLGMPPLAQNFPRRNRIISGLSLGVLVVEAHEKSGSLITVRCAIEQGREVYAIPGKIDSPTSKGTNRLLREGAKLAVEPSDVVADLEPQLKHLLQHRNSEGEPQVKEDLPVADLGDTERRILALLKEEPLSADDIVDKIGEGTSSVLSLLTTLEIKGLIKKRNGLFVPKSL